MSRTTKFKRTAHDDDNTASGSLIFQPHPRLFPRKGGGGKGGGGRSSGGKGGKGSSKPPAARKGASSAFTNSKSAQPFSLNIFGGKGKTATAYGDGGGKKFTISDGGKFNGREAGGGTRNEVYGTSRFGSGYPYGGSGYYVDQRPLPFVFYPVPVSHGYYGGNVYLDDDAHRPGGPLTSAIVQPSYNTSLVTYRITGDKSSVTTVFDALVANCSVAGTLGNSGLSAIAPFTPSPTTYPRPEQVIQYYRASSFALSLDTYNNTAALLSNMPASNSSAPPALNLDIPLPTALNTTFLACLNSTIFASVPLVDPDARRKLSNGAIAGIVIGSVVGFFILIVLVGLLWEKCTTWREQRRENEGFKKRIKWNLKWPERKGSAYTPVKS